MSIWVFLIPAALLLLVRLIYGPKSEIYSTGTLVFLLYCVACFIAITIFEARGYEMPIL